MVFEQLVALSEQLASEALGFITAKPGGGGGEGAGGGGRGTGKGKKAAAAAAAAQQLALCSGEEVRGLCPGSPPAHARLPVDAVLIQHPPAHAPVRTPLSSRVWVRTNLLSECAALFLPTPPQVSNLVARYQRTTQAFAALVELSKVHQHRVGLLGQVSCVAAAPAAAAVALRSRSRACHCGARAHPESASRLSGLMCQ
mgnify:CR=1 FL=1